MTVDDLIEVAAKQPVITVEQEVRHAGPELSALLAKKPLTVAEIESHPDQHRTMRTLRYGHLLGEGLSRGEIAKWQVAHPGHRLPNDLVELLSRVNGIHLWADLDDGASYFGVLSLAHWQDANEDPASDLFRSPPIGWLAISYHQNGDYVLFFDTVKGQYVWIDLEDFENPKAFGRTVQEFLDSWWKEALWLDPRAGH